MWALSSHPVVVCCLILDASITSTVVLVLQASLPQILNNWIGRVLCLLCDPCSGKVCKATSNNLTAFGRSLQLCQQSFFAEPSRQSYEISSHIANSHACRQSKFSTLEYMWHSCLVRPNGMYCFEYQSPCT